MSHEAISKDQFGGAISSFARRGGKWSTPAGSLGKCEVAAGDFAQHLRRSGLEGKSVEYTHPAQQVAPLAEKGYGAGEWHPDSNSYESGMGHTVVEHAGHVVDWTARQFWPDAPHPLVEPVEKYSKRWHNRVAQ